MKSRLRTLLKATTRATSQETKTLRLLKTTSRLTFVFSAENDSLDSILLRLQTSSSCISLSMLKVPNNENQVNHKQDSEFTLANLYLHKFSNKLSFLVHVVACLCTFNFTTNRSLCAKKLEAINADEQLPKTN